jgi:hypothetical protein
MKAFLMHPDRDFDLQAPLPPNADDLVQDLELDTLFGAMAAGDKYLLEVARKAMLTSLADPAAIVYRQRVLGDCLAHPDVVRGMYDMAVEAINADKKVFFGIFSSSPESVLMRAVQLLESFVAVLKRLRQVGQENAGRFASEGFTRLFAMLAEELSDDYFALVEEHIRQLKFPRGMLISARLGKGAKGVQHVLRRPLAERSTWLQRLLGKRASAYSFEIADRDEAGHRALGELRARGINLVANALAQSTDHILGFFRMLRAELAFYVGCLNLSDELGRLGEPVSMPSPHPADAPVLSAEGLYDPCLALRVKAQVVGNRLAADGRGLIVITGANQGGKSTFLRSVGIAQLMMQCGMFVAAERFAANVATAVFTHFKRQEDPGMKHGKLDEELARMSQVVDLIKPASLLLSNESFSSTNEREGSEIAGQVVRALVAAQVKVVLVTHLYHLTELLRAEPALSPLFLRAERAPDGQRTYRLTEGEPTATSHGRDLYDRIFGAGGLVARGLPTGTSG